MTQLGAYENENLRPTQIVYQAKRMGTVSQEFHEEYTQTNGSLVLFIENKNWDPSVVEELLLSQLAKSKILQGVQTSPVELLNLAFFRVVVKSFGTLLSFETNGDPVITTDIEMPWMQSGAPDYRTFNKKHEFKELKRNFDEILNSEFFFMEKRSGPSAGEHF